MATNPKDKSIKLARSLNEHLTETLRDAMKQVGDASPEGAIARGKIFQISDYFQEAAESYVEAVGADETADEAAARLIIVSLQAGRGEKALSAATTLAARNPGFLMKEVSSDQLVSAMTLLGDALAFTGRHEDAIEAYKIAASSKKDDFASGRLALLYLAIGERKKALELGKAFGENPRFRDLSRVISLGQQNDALLPTLRGNVISSMIQISMPGRPLLVGDEPIVAPVVDDDDRWCADLN